MIVSPIGHNPSPGMTHLCPSLPLKSLKMSNMRLNVAQIRDGLVTDFHGAKVHKYKKKLSIYMYLSPCHAHTRAMCLRTHEGCKPDLSAVSSKCHFSAPTIATRLRQEIDRERLCEGPIRRDSGPTCRPRCEVPPWQRISATVAETFDRVPQWQRRLGTPPGNDTGEG